MSVILGVFFIVVGYVMFFPPEPFGRYEEFTPAESGRSRFEEWWYFGNKILGAVAMLSGIVLVVSSA